MKISYHWLKELVELDLSPRDLATRMTMAGNAVDAIEEHNSDSILEFELTSNRPDCLSHLGIAREASAVLDKPLINPVKAAENVSATKTSEVTSVEVLAQDLCPRYTARVIHGVKVGPSPEWLVTRLEALGQRSVNNVADITNYVMLELGQPLHAFDLDQLSGKKIIVRRANDKEKITLLDNEERELNSEVVVICDAEKPVAIGGIKGGLHSGISESTANVLLEAAYFNPVSIRQTAKNLAVNTEASYRFERGADIEIADAASLRAANLIAEICGGEILNEAIDVRTEAQTRLPITLRAARYVGKTGLPLDLAQATKILTALGFKVTTSENSLTAIPPSWRHDMAIEEDLIEEVIRVIGYDHLKTSLPGGSGAGAYLKGDSGRRAVRQTLTALGFHEAINFSFVNAEADAALTNVAEADRLKLKNPIDSTQAEMRTTLLGGLLASLSNNLNHGTRNVKLFELGKCFAQSSSGERPIEMEKLALVMTGARNETDWQAASTRLDFYDLKGAVEALLVSLNLPNISFQPATDEHYLHPGRSAVISCGDKVIGHLGQLHPTLLSRYKFKQAVSLAELNFGLLLELNAAESRYQPLPRFPNVVRDLAMLIDCQISWNQIETTIRELSLPQLEQIRMFDLYAGKELPEGKHSLALSLRYRALDRTLTEAEINAMHAQVVAALHSKFGAELR